jgi:hypothetical protein
MLKLSHAYSILGFDFFLKILHKKAEYLFKNNIIYIVYIYIVFNFHGNLLY